MRILIDRTITSDPWIGKVGLAIVATGTAVFFALPLRTFDAFPASYRIMAGVFSEEAWAAVCASVATLSWVALWVEADGPFLRPLRRTDKLGRLVFGFVHGPLWFFVGYSIAVGTPSAYLAWWALAAFVLAEWVALSPILRSWWERREGGKRGE